MITTGQIVFSKCGRDRSKAFVVCKVVENFGFLVDGDYRKLSKPKKKKLKHIQITNKIDYNLKQKFDNEEYILDSDIRKSLLSYTKKVNELRV